MALTLDALAAMDIVGGVLLAATGAFVLIHGASRKLGVVFFTFAGADAAATILYRLSILDLPDDVRLAARGAYWWFLLIALGSLAALGALFPRPFRSWRVAEWLAGAAGVLTAVGVALYVADPSLFLIASGSGASLTYDTGPAGYLVQVALALTVAGLLLRTMTIVRRAPSDTHADQAAFVFGGVVLSYGTIPASLLVARWQGDSLWTTWPRALSSVAFAFAIVSALAAAFLAIRARGRARNVLVASVGVILLLMVGAWARLGASDDVQTVGIFIGPILLAYAILRYAVFDIDARVRRAVTLGLGGAGVAGVFVATEGVLQSFLQERFLGGVASGVVATILAGLLAAVLMLPITRVAAKVGSRLIPVRPPDAHHSRKLEIYRHALEGARHDGGIDERESRVLARLRESMGISDAEHKAMIAGGSPT